MNTTTIEIDSIKCARNSIFTVFSQKDDYFWQVVQDGKTVTSDIFESKEKAQEDLFLVNFQLATQSRTAFFIAIDSDSHHLQKITLNIRKLANISLTTELQDICYTRFGISLELLDSIQSRFLSKVNLNINGHTLGMNVAVEKFNDKKYIIFWNSQSG